MYAYGKEKVGEDDPLVSVVLRVTDSPALLTEALQSVLSQTYGKFEVIVVGGEASEEAARSCKDSRIVHLPSEGKDDGAAVRAGMDAAGGELIAYLDAAAVYYPHHLSMLVRHMRGCGCPFACSPAFQVLQVWVTDRYVTVGKRTFFNTECDRLGTQVVIPVPLSSVMHRRDFQGARDIIGRDLFPSPDGMLVRLPERHGFCRLGEPSVEIRNRTPRSEERASPPADPFGQSKDACIDALGDVLREKERRIRDLEREMREKEDRISRLEETLRDREQRLCDLEDGMRVYSLYLSQHRETPSRADAAPEVPPVVSSESGKAHDGRK